ncbi:MAG: hypothetical protein CUN55_06480 [Phototrophicales bacterium]|nr:MAG: hypothetical protein CUN55_06480 [Phototrophicales bacterium]
MEYILETIVIVTVFGALVFLANIAEQRKEWKSLFYFVLLSGNGVMLLGGLISIFMSENDDEFYGGLAFVITGIVASILLWLPVRLALVVIFPKKKDAAPTQSSTSISWLPFMMLHEEDIMYVPQGISEQVELSSAHQSTPQKQNELIGYNPHSMVHLLALVMGVYVLGGQIGLFILGGGLAGYADSIEITFLSLLPNFVPFVVLSLLGVGWLSRRSWSEVLARLGLTPPTFSDIFTGILAAFGLFFLQGMLGVMWALIVGLERFEEQTQASGAIAESINTVWLALAVALTAGIGEEIAFRGALQPIFGLWWTAVFFTLVHMQYTLTPAALIIFIVAIAFGYLRRYYGLYAVIVAHFLYNFIQLFLNVWLG